VYFVGFDFYDCKKIYTVTCNAFKGIYTTLWLLCA